MKISMNASKGKKKQNKKKKKKNFDRPTPVRVVQIHSVLPLLQKRPLEKTRYAQAFYFILEKAGAYFSNYRYLHILLLMHHNFHRF